MVALLLLLGCVTKGQHELLQVQLDATRMALNAKTSSCYEEVTKSDREIDDLYVELDRLRAQLAELSERHEQLSGELKQTREQLAALALLPRPPEDPDAQPPPEPLPPLVASTVHDIEEALAVRSRIEFEAARRKREHLEIVEHFRALEAEGRLQVMVENSHTVVRIPTVQIFNEGRVSVSPRGEVLLQGLAAALADSHGKGILVSAHTDNVPYHTAEHDSNWDLGFAQAATVVYALKQANVPAEFGAASFAAERPIASNDTAEGRKANNRIELLFEPDLTGLPGMTPDVGTVPAGQEE